MSIKVLGLIIVGVIAAVFAAQLPELRRYMSIRSM
jgi:Family of unknown function (DUF6893)